MSYFESVWELEEKKNNWEENPNPNNQPGSFYSVFPPAQIQN